MAEDGAGETAVRGTVPEPLAAWLDREAADRDVSRDEFLSRMLAGFRAATDGETVVADVDEVDRLADAEARFDEKLADVRERVIQIKREADAKAAADHDHSDLEREVRDVSRAAEDAENAVESLRVDVEELSMRTERGFENYEEVLEYLTDATEDLDGKATTLAEAVLDLRERVRETGDARRDALDELAREANRRGVRTADCGECDGSVDVALLTEPACPHCASAFTGVESKRGILGSATLETGDRPATEAGGDEPLGDAAGVEALVDRSGDDE